MENVWVSSQPKRSGFERPGPPTPRVLADLSYLVQLVEGRRLAYLPFALHERDAWAILFLEGGISEAPGDGTAAGDRRRFEALNDVVTSLLAADAWSREHRVPIVACPADERVRQLFESRGLSDCLFIPITELLGRLEHLFLARVDERRVATLRVFPEGRPNPPGPARGAGEAESPGDEPERPSDRGDDPSTSLADGLFSIEEPRRQLRIQLQESRDRAAALGRRLSEVESELRTMKRGRAWRLACTLVRFRHWLIPADTRRGRVLEYAGAFARVRAEQGLRAALARASAKVLRRLAPSLAPPAGPPAVSLDGRGIYIPIAGLVPPAAEHHREPVDVVVWIDRGFDEARACLEAVVRRTRPPYQLVLVHDGRDAAALESLRGFAQAQGARLVCDPSATDPASAMDVAIRRTDAEFLAFLRCTTEVTRDWLDRLVACLSADRRAEVAVPLSDRLLDGPSAIGDGEPEESRDPGLRGPDAHEMASRIAADSGRLRPPLSRFDDGCLLARRPALAESLATASRPSGAEVGSPGWTAVLADDAYVHIGPATDAGPARPPSPADRILEGIRARTRRLHVRHALRSDGRRRWEGRRVLFVLPARRASGAANAVLQEAAAMLTMGVDVRVLNLEAHRRAFRARYPELEVPALFAADPSELPAIARGYDAVIATRFPAVEWMRPLRELDRPPRLGYYIPDNEPSLVAGNPGRFWRAWSSYLAIPELVRLTKTAWTRAEVERLTGAESLVIGPSVNVDLFRPRPRLLPERPDVVRVAAMVRPGAPHRQPRLTMEALRAMHHAHGDRVEILIFGCRTADLGDLPRDFPFRNEGILNPRQMAALLNEVDVLADFSIRQSLGLTSMEAMCCGAAAIAPTCGGAEGFIRHEQDGFLVDTSLAEDCIDALDSLIRETGLRRSLQARALRDIGRFFPERAAHRILDALFPHPAEAR